jgi:hypothetical protein
MRQMVSDGGKIVLSGKEAIVRLLGAEHTVVQEEWFKT